MQNYITNFMCSLCLTVPLIGSAQSMPAEKEAVVQSVAQHQDQLIQMSDQIWAFAETALTEHQSAKVLADYARANGFTVEH